MFLSEEGRTHATLARGKNVYGAVELQVKSGKIEWISNGLGHYQPGTVYQYSGYMDQLLEKYGIGKTKIFQYKNFDFEW